MANIPSLFGAGFKRILDLARLNRTVVLYPCIHSNVSCLIGIFLWLLWKKRWARCRVSRFCKILSSRKLLFWTLLYIRKLPRWSFIFVSDWPRIASLILHLFVTWAGRPSIRLDFGDGSSNVVDPQWITWKYTLKITDSTGLACLTRGI